MKAINPQDLVPMDEFVHKYPLRIDLLYRQDREENLFGIIYHDAARLWLHKDLAAVSLMVAQNLAIQHGWTLVLFDGLRTTDAQLKMLSSDNVQANPQWLEEPRLLSPPGKGAHPRGMAIDVYALDEAGAVIDMGTVIDYLGDSSAVEDNPAHRLYPMTSETAANHRAILQDAMIDAARVLGVSLLPLPQEWWDFRRPLEVYDAYAPLSDLDLPPYMRMTDAHEVRAPSLEEDQAIKERCASVAALVQSAV